jgi:hypothetical protein
MQDLLQVLPTEIWVLCMEFAVAGRVAGPLEFITVSRDWESALLDSPSLWTEIYIQNGEDEIARISTFLHLSKQCKLHVDVMTVLPTVDNLRLVGEHISRVTTISIRPGALDTFTALHAKHWRRTAGYVLESLSNGMHLSEVEPPIESSIICRDDGQWYYHVILLHFTMAARVAKSDDHNRMWEDHLTKYACTSLCRILYLPLKASKRIPARKDKSRGGRARSISSIATLGSYGELQLLIRAQ